MAYGYGRPVQSQNIRVIRRIEDLTDEELLSLTESAERQQKLGGTQH